MKNLKNNRRGFSVVELVVVLVVISAIGMIGYYSYGKFNEKQSAPVTSANSQEVAKKSPAKIKHIGFNLDYYDPATNKAGDMEFTKKAMSFPMMYMGYGFTVPASSAGPAKKNPQPTFILPLGTKVHALVDGEVFEVPKLYSNDYSVMIQGEGSDLIFETEHVINVVVKKGQKVKAGDVVAEVSDYDAKNWAGYGLFEIGVLKGGNPPSHLCTFDYLDDSIKDDVNAKLTALMKSWEQYRGDTSIYDEASAESPGCVTRDPIEG
jgi:prepilin-type N-terminal cleavage/methylation domain-containing protein